MQNETILKELQDGLDSYSQEFETMVTTTPLEEQTEKWLKKIEQICKCREILLRGIYEFHMRAKK